MRKRPDSKAIQFGREMIGHREASDRNIHNVALNERLIRGEALAISLGGFRNCSVPTVLGKDLNKSEERAYCPDGDNLPMELDRLVHHPLVVCCHSGPLALTAPHRALASIS